MIKPKKILMFSRDRFIFFGGVNLDVGVCILEFGPLFLDLGFWILESGSCILVLGSSFF